MMFGTLPSHQQLIFLTDLFLKPTWVNGLNLNLNNLMMTKRISGFIWSITLDENTNVFIYL